MSAPNIIKLIVAISITVVSLFLVDLTIDDTKTSVYFSPNGGCTSAIVDEIKRAKKEILIQAYSFTSAPISKALLSAKERGINIIAVVDKSNIKNKATVIGYLAKVSQFF